MAHFHNNALIGASGQGGYLINQSLRFNSADSAYLNRTPASAGNRKTWTWSGWVKRAGLSTDQALLQVGTASSDSTFFRLRIDSTNLIRIGGGLTSWRVTTPVYRDSSAWYHIVLAIDTTQATANNRIRLYVNGAEVTAFNTLNNPTQNSDLAINDAVAHNIGRDVSGADYLNGYLAEVNFIDGQALTPSSFGETDTITGAWIPKKYSGSYGTNGFYLNFSDNSGTTSTTLGKDSSGNGNNWTPNNFSVTAGAGNDVMSDTPTNNWCTLNPLVVIPRGTISNGNLNYLSGSTASHGSAAGSFTLPTTGKWYWEVTACANSGGSGNNEAIGIANIQNNPQLPASGSEIGSRSGDYAYRSSAARVSGGSSVSYGATYTNGDVIGVAWDSDAGTVVFYKNGSSQGTAYSSITQEAGKYAPASSNAESSNGDDFNFGQRAFAYTPPTGFKALNTANLPEPTIKKGSKYFDTKLYTGDSNSTQSITGVGFQPDFVWIKNRGTGGTDHLLFDAVRGVTKVLKTVGTGPEETDANAFQSFNSDGFTLGTSTSGNPTKANGSTYVAWAWDANGAGSSNTAGTITSTVSANASAGFSIVTWTGTGADGSYGHGLGVQPSMIIHKRRDSTSDWHVWHKGLPTKSPTNDVIYLNLTNAQNGGNSNLFRLDPTSTLIYTGNAGSHNVNGATYVDYVFSEVVGYSKFGSYTGNGSTDGVFVHCGFRPAFLLIKQTNGTGDWYLLDSKRATYNPSEPQVIPNSSASETSYTGWGDLLSNGFKIRRTDSAWNGSGSTYIFAAFAELPAKYSNAR